MENFTRQNSIRVIASFGVVIILTVIFSPLLAQVPEKGTLIGKITDQASGEALVGATIQIEGTSQGAAADLDGKYYLESTTIGKKKLIISYIGYQSLTQEVTIVGGLNTFNFSLQIDSKVMDEVVVTAQALGQAGAINQQINAPTIVSVISRDRIRELPDQNAAETVGRISGVYVQRDAGEGQKVVLRGIAPRFSNVLVNGIRLPSTDPTDRSVDLSMVAPDMLSGIEIYKSMRPDLDADAIGGAVNFQFKKASDEPELLVNAQYGYNGQARELGQYKTSLSYSKRFLNEKLGLVMTGNYQRANRSSDQLRGAYTFVEQDVFGNNLIEPAELTLNYINEIRTRYGGSLTADFKINENNTLLMNGFYGLRNSDEVRRRRRYRWDEQRQEHDIRDRVIDVSIFSGSLTGEHRLRNSWTLTWQGAFSRSKQEAPNIFDTRFRELSAFSTASNLINQSADSLIKLANNDIQQTFMNAVALDSDQIIEDAANLQIDLKIPLNVGDKISAYIKTGVKYRDNIRSRDFNSFVGNYFSSTSGEIKDFLDDFPTLYQRVSSNGGIGISNFLTGPTPPDFLNGDYFIGPGTGNTNGPGLSRNATSGLIQNMQSFGYLSKNFLADIDDYTATEKIYAGYAMTEVEIQKKLLILAGVRFERTITSYRGNFMKSGVDADDGGAFTSVTVDSTGGRSYNEFLPMLHLRYKISPKIDVRFAATRTMGRPNFSSLIPLRRINDSDQFIDQANPLLLQTNTWNYDLNISFYTKNILFTVGGFHKRLRNIDYIRSFTRIFPVDDPFAGYLIRTPDNSSDVTRLTGLEVDIQSNLRFLPNPFNGFILGFNMTYLTSETFFPAIPLPVRSPDRPFTPSVITDGFRSGRAPLQANAIVNASLGYERGGFTGRISMVYQGDTFRDLGTLSALDSFQDGNTRFDLALKQRVTKFMKVYVNCNNFTNAAEISFFGGRSRRTAEDYFGFTADLGVQFQF
jgi:TonB-dependent receptor